LIRWETCRGSFRAFRDVVPGEGETLLFWLGQAGFAMRSRDTFALIDPYLSDHLAEKYRGREFPHQRMMSAPCSPEDIRELDFVCCTHRHSDHMDPGTLPVIAENNPHCRFIVPAAEKTHALEIGLPENNLCLVDAGQTVHLTEDVRIRLLPSAHEELEQNEKGEHRYLGCVVKCGAFVLYHSGDCVPWDGLAGALSEEAADLALLPVNGRDAYRRERGVPGNMTFDEAAALCREAAIPRLIPHHFDMFDFNTVPREMLREKINQLDGAPACRLPETTHYESFRSE
jgi:L-ascorbate metabolism protein UlaG (beta-lactamase superfamily)